jgi:hypothetical protein
MGSIPRLPRYSSALPLDPPVSSADKVLIIQLPDAERAHLYPNGRFTLPGAYGRFLCGRPTPRRLPSGSHHVSGDEFNVRGCAACARLVLDDRRMARLMRLIEEEGDQQAATAPPRSGGPGAVPGLVNCRIKDRGPQSWTGAEGS